MAYQIREVFYTLQGEGAQSGRPAVFCRFAGCNLWSGREQDRATAVCQFCDTQLSAPMERAAAASHRPRSWPITSSRFWPAGESRHRFTVLTAASRCCSWTRP